MAMKKKTIGRWKIAQRYEKRRWSRDSQNVLQTDWTKIKERYSDLSRIEKEIEMTDDWRILDVGCGPTLMCRLFQKGEKHGIDPLMEGFLKLYNLPKGVHLSKGRGEELPFKDRSFDLVISRNVLDHVQDPREVLTEMVRVLKKGGYLILASNVYAVFPVSIKKIVEKLGIPLKEVYHPHFFTSNELRILCNKYGSIIEEKVVFEDSVDDFHRDFMCASIRFVHAFRRREINEICNYAFWTIVRFLNRKLFNEASFFKEYMIVAKLNDEHPKKVLQLNIK